jgi:beta-lactamase class A
MQCAMKRALALVLALACGGAPSGPDAAKDVAKRDASPADAAAEVSLDASADAAALATPDTPAGRQLAWLLSVFNGDPNTITPELLAPHFAPAFLAQVPAADLAALLANEARTVAPLVLVSIAPGATDTRLVAIVRTANSTYRRIIIQVTAMPEQFTGLLLQLAPEADPTLTDWASLEPRLSRSAPKVEALVAELSGDECRAVHAISPAVPAPLGSAFKLWVLGALAQKIARGEASWDDAVELREEWKSLPSGELQNLPAGTRLTVREMAAKMIAISDNTAADHLIRLVGRAAVEAAQASLGMAHPERNVPFLTTRELFVLKLALTDDERAAYLAAGPEERRRRLDEVYAQIPLSRALAAAGGWTAPRLVEQLEWFGTPEDVCRVYAALRKLAAAPSGAPLLGILSANPGLPVDTRTFRYVGFKGGSEPGVLAGSWLLRRADDRSFVVAVSSTDTVAPIDEDSTLYLWLATIQLVGREL